MSDPDPQDPSGAERPELVRFLLGHCLSGVAAGWVFLLGLVWTDAFGVGGLLRNSEHGALAMLMLAAVFAVTFGSAAMGAGVMLMRGRDRQP